MEDYKQYLNDNAEDAEQRAAQQVMEGLERLRLEAKVREVAAERATLQRRAFWQRLFFSSIALALFAGAVYFMYVEMGLTQQPTQPQVPSQQQSAPVPTLQEQSQPQKQQNDKTTSQPIAKISTDERLPNSSTTAPNMSGVRGGGDPNKPSEARLKEMWYTNYPLTGVNISPNFIKADESLKTGDFKGAYMALMELESELTDNDTLRYLQGYCLLVLGQGDGALSLLDRVQGKHQTWEPQLQWYRGLAMLMADEEQGALEVFKKIAADPKHRYYKKALEALKGVE
jgi:hypothetical protein